MRHYIALSLLVASLVACCVLAASNLHLHKTAFEDFKLAHGKQYESADEELARFEIFSRNLQKIQRHNAEPSSFKLAVNRFTDMNETETRKLNGLRAPTFEQLLGFKDDEFVNSLLDVDAKVPDEHDWRKIDGVVSAVKDQGQCRSCWAFASTGVLEGQEKVLGLRELNALSEQDLVDCSEANYGCNGGLMAKAFMDIHKMGGIESSADYPYEARDGKCRFKKSKSVMTDSNGIILSGKSEEDLKKLVYNYGPVSVGIASNIMSFLSYSEGIFSDERCSNKTMHMDHGVLIVGYGVDKNHGDYWIIKNSWGIYWGEQGYMKMARNMNSLCGVTNIPTIAKI